MSKYEGKRMYRNYPPQPKSRPNYRQEKFENRPLRKHPEMPKEPKKSMKILIPAMKNPFASKEEFQYYQSKEIDQKTVDKYYNQYFEDYQINLFDDFFENHKKEAWFED